MVRKNTPSNIDVKSLHEAIDHIEKYEHKLYAAAVWYAEHGIKIIPFMSYGYPKGLSQHYASDNVEQIMEWWHPDDGRFAGASIAMAHGGEAGYCAVDLDVKDTDGIQSLVDLQSVYGDYDDGEGEGLQTLMATTPSGGRHLVFKYHPEIISNSEATYKGIDTRGGLKREPSKNGGITFIEPSKKPNTEGTYRWDDTISEIKEIPEWLVDILNGRTPKDFKGIALQESYDESASGKHGEGRDRNIYIDLLRFIGAGYTEDQLWALKPKILERMNPPDEVMVDRKINSAIQSEAFFKAKEKAKTKKQVNSLELATNDKGNVLKCVNNLEIILSSDIFDYEYGEIAYDDFTQGFTLNKKPLASVVDWSIGIQSWISKKFMIDYQKTEIRDKVEYIAYQNPHINIARDYMMSCVKDHHLTDKRDGDFWGSGRKSGGNAFYRLCTEVLDLGNPELHQGYNDDLRISYEAFLWFWLQGVVARACVPACKMEIVLNIFGDQGIGKSLFFRGLCPNPAWFTDSLQDTIVGGGTNNRDELMKLHAKIIVEMPELNPIKRGGKSADDKLKQFISTQTDNFRRPYGHDAVDHPRTCALAGTSNNRDVYRDATGNRRFVSIDHGDEPIFVGDLDKGVMREIKDDLWGEIVSSFNDGELDLGNVTSLLVSIPPKLRGRQKQVNSQHKYEEIGINEVKEWMEGKTRVTWDEILQYAKTVPGFGDMKESIIIGMTRKELSNDQVFQFKKRVMRHNKEGHKEKVNCWVNTEMRAEIAHQSGQEPPLHWSRRVDTTTSEY